MKKIVNKSTALRRNEDPRKVCEVGVPKFSNLPKQDASVLFSALVSIVNEHFKVTSKKG